MNSTDVSQAIDSIDHCSAAVRRWFLLNDFSSTPASPRWCSWIPLLSFGQSPTSPLSMLLEAVYSSHHNSSLSASSSIHACDLTATRETLIRHILFPRDDHYPPEILATSDPPTSEGSKFGHILPCRASTVRDRKRGSTTLNKNSARAFQRAVHQGSMPPLTSSKWRT